MVFISKLVYSEELRGGRPQRAGLDCIFIGTNFNQLALMEAKSIVETVDIRFVYQCATEIGAPKSWIGDKCQENMVSWMEMDPRIRPLKVAMWNNLKGGGDNLTKLADICQEKNWRAFGQSGRLHQDSFEHWIGVSNKNK